MTFFEFQQTLSHSWPPEGMPPLLQALWWEGSGEWERAHAIAQDEQGPNAAWVHAYLHRKEGDDWNAGFWYRLAGKAPCSALLNQEWQEIVTALLQAGVS
jgi:hypothetical protein